MIRRDKRLAVPHFDKPPVAGREAGAPRQRSAQKRMRRDVRATIAFLHEALRATPFCDRQDGEVALRWAVARCPECAESHVNARRRHHTRRASTMRSWPAASAMVMTYPNAQHAFVPLIIPQFATVASKCHVPRCRERSLVLPRGQRRSRGDKRFDTEAGRTSGLEPGSVTARRTSPLSRRRSAPRPARQTGSRTRGHKPPNRFVLS